MAHAITVLDYGSGNVRSACRALERVGARVMLTGDLAQAREADGLVVPGVGAVAAVGQALREAGGADVIAERVQASRGVLGICVGMQILFSAGAEGGSLAAGLGYFDGTVSRLDAPVVPHMGWSTVEAAPDSALFTGVADERFYFVHSYAALEAPANHPDARCTWATHGSRFLAAIEWGPLSATQFHPEKSGQAGQKVLANWLATL